jgi:hypothetical protein
MAKDWSKVTDDELRKFAGSDRPSMGRTRDSFDKGFIDGKVGRKLAEPMDRYYVVGYRKAAKPFPAYTRCARRQMLQKKKGHIYFCHKWGGFERPMVRGVRAVRFTCEHCGLVKTRTYNECGMPRAWNYSPKKDEG